MLWLMAIAPHVDAVVLREPGASALALQTLAHVVQDAGSLAIVHSKSASVSGDGVHMADHSPFRVAPWSACPVMTPLDWTAPLIQGLPTHSCPRSGHRPANHSSVALLESTGWPGSLVVDASWDSAALMSIVPVSWRRRATAVLCSAGCSARTVRRLPLGSRAFWPGKSRPVGETEVRV
jgi:hypothetical protein